MAEAYGPVTGGCLCGAALRQLQDVPDVDLLLTNVAWPGGMTGRDLATVVQQQRPEVKVLFMSGYAQDALAHDGRLEDGVTLLQKPFPKKELARKVRDVLNRDSAAL